MLNIEKYEKAVLDSLSYCVLEGELEDVDTGLKEECNNRLCSECKKQLREWLLSEFKGQILDEAERKYLSAVIRPFRKKVKHIAIWDTCNGSKQFVHIKLYDEDCINLPNFKPNAMYKGMELHKEYTLEELGL